MNNRKEIAKEFAKAIKSKYISRVILFGSVARGEDNIDSDIDILIITSSRKKISHMVSDEVYNIIANYHEVISAHMISEEYYNRTKDYSFLTEVQKEGIILV